MKENYQELELEVISFENQDIITSSGNEGVGEGDDVDDYRIRLTSFEGALLRSNAPSERTNRRTQQTAFCLIGRGLSGMVFSKWLFRTISAWEDIHETRTEAKP